jgi:hypothetical protein
MDVGAVGAVVTGCEVGAATGAEASAVELGAATGAVTGCGDVEELQAANVIANTQGKTR